MTTANAEQRAAWDGEFGERWVATADRRDDVYAPIADLLLGVAAIAAGERVLDIGCGCGFTSLAAAVATGRAGSVVGADLSAPMLDLARTRADGHRHVEYLQADVQTDALGGPFDVAISRFGTMFFDDPIAAFRNVGRHLSPGGRLCFASWQPRDANQWLVLPQAALLEFGKLPEEAASTGPGMFAQCDASTISGVLTAADFADISVEPYAVALRLGGSVTEAGQFLTDSGPGRAIFETIPADRHAEAIAALSDCLRPHDYPGHGVTLEAGVLLTTARAQP